MEVRTRASALLLNVERFLSRPFESGRRRAIDHSALKMKVTDPGVSAYRARRFVRGAGDADLPISRGTIVVPTDAGAVRCRGAASA